MTFSPLSVAVVAAALVGGAFLWTIAEYVLHSSFHWRRGRDFPSRAHLDHHVHASWHFDPVITLAWLGVILIGFGFGAVGALVIAAPIAYGLGAGWTLGYFFYEWHHRAAHLRGPRNRWEAWLRINHFNHHFGRPMMNQSVIVPWWDRIFSTSYRPDKVRVPRRLAMVWLLDETGAVRSEYAADYELVGTDERRAALDRARAFANLEPVA